MTNKHSMHRRRLRRRGDRRHGQEHRLPRDEEELLRPRACAAEAGTGMNCIRIGLPGKPILSKRKGLLEVLFS